MLFATSSSSHPRPPSARASRISRVSRCQSVAAHNIARWAVRGFHHLGGEVIYLLRRLSPWGFPSSASSAAGAGVSERRPGRRGEEEPTGQRQSMMQRLCRKSLESAAEQVLVRDEQTPRGACPSASSVTVLVLVSAHSAGSLSPCCDRHSS